MIHVLKAKEPRGFKPLVQYPGTAFLVAVANPKGNDWRGHTYWRACIPDLYKAYGGICAYTCHWIPQDTGSITVDHFLPKDQHPKKAYSWLNFRLASGRLNGRKGTNKCVDPFKIDGRWFSIDFPSLLVKAGPEAPARKMKLINETIRTLKLNDEGSSIQARLSWVMSYVKGEISFTHLERYAPFIARELKAQRLVKKIKVIMA